MSTDAFHNSSKKITNTTVITAKIQTSKNTRDRCDPQSGKDHLIITDPTWKRAEEKYLEISYVDLLWEYFQEEKK